MADASLSLARGTIVALLGPSGSGKTTLTEILAGTVTPDAGRVIVDGRDVTSLPAHRRRIPVVPQEWDLFPHLTLLDNTAFGLRVAGIGRAERRRQASRLLNRVGLDGRLAAYPNELSGGQQQRAALARALATPASFILLDEPFANVDQETRRDLRRLVAEAVDGGRGVLLITHDQSDALRMADQIACIIAGSVEMIGTPLDVYEKPSTLAVARLTGEAFLFPLTNERSRRVAGASNADKDAVILRPQWLEPVDVTEEADLHARVSRCIYKGDHFLVELSGADWPVYVRSRRPWPPRAPLGLRLPRDRELVGVRGPFSTEIHVL